RADLFSLGSVLYAMCAGHSPFRAKTTMGVLRRVSDESPRPLGEINPEVPEALEAIIGRLHAKDPADRYQSASEVAEGLGRYLAELQRPGVRSAARRAPSSTTEPAKSAHPINSQARPAATKEPRRPRARAAMLAATVVLALLGLTVSWASARFVFHE